MRKEGDLGVETLKDSSVYSWMNLREICWGIWLNRTVKKSCVFASTICLLYVCNDAQALGRAKGIFNRTICLSM